MALITVTGTFYKPGASEPVTNFIRFVRYTAPQVVGSFIACPFETLAAPDSAGVISQVLLSGYYYVYPNPDDKDHFLSIFVDPNGAASQDVKDITTGNVVDPFVVSQIALLFPDGTTGYIRAVIVDGQKSISIT